MLGFDHSQTVQVDPRPNPVSAPAGNIKELHDKLTFVNLASDHSHLETERMNQISKTEFKTHALQVLREIEQSGVSRIITDRGVPKLEIIKLRQREKLPLEILKGTVLKYDDATIPVAIDDWELA